MIYMRFYIFLLNLLQALIPSHPTFFDDMNLTLFILCHCHRKENLSKELHDYKRVKEELKILIQKGIQVRTR